MVKVHLDTDLGGDIDDLCALAMLLKWPKVRITGITTVADDKGIRAGFVKYALKLAGKSDIPVKAGADISLGRYRVRRGYQDERYWPKEAIKRAKNPIGEALALLKKSIAEGAIIIGIGPLTNLYLLGKKYPGILRQAKLFLMGGYIYPPRDGYPRWGQNYDFNIQVDVKAAKEVLENSCPTLVPLTVTIETFLRQAYLGKLRQSDDLNRLLAKQAEVFADDEKIAEKYGRVCPKLPDDIINFQHDPLTTAIALGWHDGVEFKGLPLRFSIQNGWLKEMVDKSSQKFYRVVTKIDGEKFSRFWLERVIA
ncbi:nucleoside hydrolase [Candidatus Shapirobacteria bacterium]|nr:nucleoside hydrolase [Candidatus Shapirobacteria bacterium]